METVFAVTRHGSPGGRTGRFDPSRIWPHTGHMDTELDLDDDGRWSDTWYMIGYGHGTRLLEHAAMLGDPSRALGLDADDLIEGSWRSSSDPGPFARELVEEGIIDALARRPPRC